MSNQNNNSPNDLTNLISRTQANQSQPSGNNLLEQALFQQFFVNQQPQRQQQQQQQNLDLSALQQQQPLANATLQQPQQNLQLLGNLNQPQQQQQQQQQQQPNMNFRSGLALNSFETLVAAPTPLMPQQVYPHVLQRHQQQPQRPSANVTERGKFFIFVKILMKLCHNNPSVRARAKAIISECTRRNRMGDLEYSPLQDAVERRLKNGVGELYWARAKLFFDAYCERQGIRSATSLAQVPVASI